MTSHYTTKYPAGISTAEFEPFDPLSPFCPKYEPEVVARTLSELVEIRKAMDSAPEGAAYPVAGISHNDMFSDEGSLPYYTVSNTTGIDVISIMHMVRDYGPIVDGLLEDPAYTRSMVETDVKRANQDMMYEEMVRAKTMRDKAIATDPQLFLLNRIAEALEIIAGYGPGNDE